MSAISDEYVEKMRHEVVGALREGIDISVSGGRLRYLLDALEAARRDVAALTAERDQAGSLEESLGAELSLITAERDVAREERDQARAELVRLKSRRPKRERKPGYCPRCKPEDLK